MKFSSSLFALFAVTSVYAYSLESHIVARQYDVNFNDAVQCENNCNNDEIYIDHENAKVCKQSFESVYKDCRFIEDDNIDNMCKTFESEKCNSFFKKSINTLSGCENMASQLLKKYETLKEHNYNAYILKCSKDENNEYCPLSKFTFYERSSQHGFGPTKINVEDKEIVEAINSSCHSKSCFTAAIKVITMSKENAKLLNTEDDESNYCVSHVEKMADGKVSTDSIGQNVLTSKSNENTSGTSMKINSRILLNGLLVLLITLYFI